MDGWHTAFLGLRAPPQALSAFELQAFFTFSTAERSVIDERRKPMLKLGLALHIGFLRMSGRSLDAFRVVPALLWRHLGEVLGCEAPELASLRALYRRRRTLFEHQRLACEVLGFSPVREHQRRYLVSILSDELWRQSDPDRLMMFVRRWLYEHQLLIPHGRTIRKLVTSATAEFDAQLDAKIRAQVEVADLDRWCELVTASREDGRTLQSWLWAAPAKHSTPQIAEVLERIEYLYGLGIERRLKDVPDPILRRYARRLTSRPPSVGARIQEPARTIEVACFLRYCLLSATDQLILMIRRRIADLARKAGEGLSTNEPWKKLYCNLLDDITGVTKIRSLPERQLRERIDEIEQRHRSYRPPTRAALVREHLIEAIRSSRSLLQVVIKLPWQAHGAHPVADAIASLRGLYERHQRELPDNTPEFALGSVWKSLIAGEDRERAFRSLEVATLSALRRAVRNGSVWIDHSLSFRSREHLFIPMAVWKAESRKHYARLQLPTKASAFLDPLLERVRKGVDAVDQAARAGILQIDDELHLAALKAEEEAPAVQDLRTRLDHRIGEAQLPDLMLEVDAQTRFSWIMLGREPRSADELLMVYAGILAHGTSLSAAETARMIPSLSASSVRQAMRWVGDERRLAEANAAVLTFMQRHPIAASWGRDDLASSDMMSLETTRRVWQARLDPRRNTPSVGIYSHVSQRWSVFYAQPVVLNERQAGPAIEGVVRQESLDLSQLAVDTHGYTDFGMMLARLNGFDLCPRLKSLRERRLFIPQGWDVPESLRSACSACVAVDLVPEQWDRLVNLAASVLNGTSAVAVLARFGSCAKGDPLYEAGVQIGRLLRTVFLADFWTNPAFRREILRVLNRGEAVNALKRLIYAGRVANHQARRVEEMQAVAEALNLLANIIMAWNTAQMQAVLDSWANRRQIFPPELTGRIAPTHVEGINLRGIFRFPIDRFASILLPSQAELIIVASR